jgi:hypothetical protein
MVDPQTSKVVPIRRDASSLYPGTSKMMKEGVFQDDIYQEPSSRTHSATESTRKKLP